MNSPTTLLLQDLINAPTQVESLLECLSTEQITLIETTINKIKLKKKLSKEQKKDDPMVNALAAAMVSTYNDSISPSKTIVNKSNHNDLVSEVKDGVEWVSFVYSHNRTLKRYSIRTDISSVAIDQVDDKFKAENCVYPRANLPKETYKGNRWAYETECNDLGWKLAWLNKQEIAGKRGLIQRAVDSYRNRYPSMRSRRVARQEKLLNGTLRKRKQREEDNKKDELDEIITKQQPKTMAIEDETNRYRIKINVESIALDDISMEFRKQNCPFPRAINADPEEYFGGMDRYKQDTMCNELCWKLAHLNPKVLAGKKNLLQRALDIYRTKFMPSLKPRKRSCREAPQPTLVETTNDTIPNQEDPMISPSYDAQFSPFDESSISSSSATSVACTPSPPITSDLFGFVDTDIYDSFMLPPVNEGIFETKDQDKVDQEQYQDDYSSATHLLDPLF